VGWTGDAGSGLVRPAEKKERRKRRWQRDRRGRITDDPWAVTDKRYSGSPVPIQVGEIDDAAVK